LFFFEHEISDVWEYFALEELITMAFERELLAPDYEKKIKMQNKMIKIQTGKIQKISQRDSKKECNVQQLE
jgi:hypothetical protein